MCVSVPRPGFEGAPEGVMEDFMRWLITEDKRAVTTRAVPQVVMK